jgi:uncharacterized membrane-anchored protein
MSRVSAPASRPLLRVPEITAYFWIAKALTTAFGESSSDYLVHAMPPEFAVLVGFVAFAIALLLQLRRGRYVAWNYWAAVAMVGVFGTMAADVLHVGLHVPYVASSLLYAVFLAAVFFVWWRVEGTLSIHAITTRRRELFYWAAVVGTFALGTAVGDLTSVTLHLGYLTSIVLFACAICVPSAIALANFGGSGVAVFWSAYVLTRPLGASIADWLGKPTAQRGLGAGSGTVSLVLAMLIVTVVSYLTLTDVDARARARHPLLDRRPE